ncbi:hypothetical protein [Sphingobacterium thalpophilum]|uniref:Uncharacterized protein n=1 Tax=Sphingobacterium thalpophilum TaxID=259 RepID=A0A4U9URC2_9SPHI|nr:hypothetical protein [Sphingobacterium thalpophilum]VTR34749.1 Uncharacterised protein [Sphingobacterium thalpophilum]
MKIHIGDIIKREAKNQGISNARLMEEIKVKNSQNIEYDLKQETLSIQKLALYTAALNHNFLKYYTDLEPFRSFYENENNTSLEKINFLKEQLDQANRTISMQEETIQTQKDLIDTQKALIESLSTKK